MLDIFQGEDNQRCVPTDTQRWPSYKKVAVVREPTDRFYAGYDEWFARRLSKKHTIPSNVRAVSEVRDDFSSEFPCTSPCVQHRSLQHRSLPALATFRR
jgi:hypothetical protein